LNKVEESLSRLKAKYFVIKKKPVMHTIQPKEEKKPEIAIQTEQQETKANPKPKQKKQVETENLDTSALLKKKSNRDS
jgi:hypothetical protein